MARIPANKTMNIDNYNDIRGRTTSSSKTSSRSALITSNASSILYHERMEINNNLLDKEFRDPIDSSQPSYKDNNKEKNPVSKVVTNFIQLVSPQPVDQFSQTKLLWKAPYEGYLHMCGMYKSNNKQLRY